MATKLSSLDGDHLAVVAIDFGTTYTGYAYSYRHDYQRIYTSTAGGKFTQDRFPTTVLLSPDRTFNSLGIDAENKYARLALNEKHKKWFFFKRFKMALYMTETVSRDATINDSEGRPMSAMLIFTMTIKHLKDCARYSIGESITQINDNDILWMLTVPAIWTDSSKQFMREAAIQTGLAENQIRLVLEPEAASLFCKEQPIMKISDDSKEIVRLSEGHTYILGDIGGGTVDICVHQIVADGNLRELYRATGDALGGTCVDMAFQQLFIKLIGADVWMAFKEEYMDEYLNLMRDFETRKTTFSTATKEEEVFSLPAGLTGVIENKMGQTLQEVIPETNYSDCISVNRRNKLKISFHVMENFFKPTINGIIKLLKEVLAEMECDNIQTLLLVGGFSESPYLREVTKAALNEKQVIFPPDGSLAVLKGAVLMGYRPRTITERRARFSYGFDTVEKFQEGVHPEKLKCTRDGVDLCEGIFGSVLEQGQVLTYGQVIKYSSRATFNTKQSKSKTYHASLYKSSQPHPKFCIKEEGCSLMGKIEIKPPKDGWPDTCESELHFIVGETEFTVNVFIKTTGDQHVGKIDFLQA